MKCDFCLNDATHLVCNMRDFDKWNFICELSHDKDVSEGHFYSVPLNELKTDDQRTHWLQHLTGKRWFSDSVRADFVEKINQLPRLHIVK